MKISLQDLIDKDFIEYGIPFGESCDKYYQKKYKDGRGIKYFLEVKHYTLIHPITKEDLSGYEVSGQFYLKGSHEAVNMEFLDSSIEKAEEFVNTLFDNNLLEYYEEN